MCQILHLRSCLKPGGHFRLKRGVPLSLTPGRGLRINCVDRVLFHVPACFNSTLPFSFAVSAKLKLSVCKLTQTTRGTLFSTLPQFRVGGTNPCFMHLGESMESVLDLVCSTSLILFFAPPGPLLLNYPQLFSHCGKKEQRTHNERGAVSRGRWQAVAR